MKKLEKALCLALVLTILFTFSGFTACCEDIPNHVLRLHVLANSDSSADQSLKLKVRDRILKESAGILDGASDKENAEKIVSAQIPKLQNAAADEIKKHGYDYPVKVTLTNMYFTTRQYDDVTLPAGRYDALRVTIGSGKGHNWWCVLFPPMCLPAAEKKEELKDVLNKNELGITENKGGYIVKFKTVEAYEQFKEWLKNKDS